MCCACNGGEYNYNSLSESEAENMEESQNSYKKCLENNSAENIASNFECDLMNTTYDQYEYRAVCFNDDGLFTWSADCQGTRTKIEQRLKCYKQKHPENAENPNSLGFCESQILSLTKDLDTIYNQVYYVTGLTVGQESYHFLEESEGQDQYSYVSYENAPKDWTLLDGTMPPGKKYFDNPVYNSDEKTFRGEINWGENTLFNAAKFEYEMVFSDNLLSIEGGTAKHINFEGDVLGEYNFGSDLVYKIRKERPSLQIFVNCYEEFTLTQYKPQLCGCEQEGIQFCDFNSCDKGKCRSCSQVDTVQKCDTLLLNDAGANDCKLRCFSVIETTAQQQEEECGHFEPYVMYNNFSVMPEKLREKFCNLFYPFPHQHVSDQERNECYEQLDIEISKSLIYTECIDQYDSLENYLNCFVRLGTESKADACKIMYGIFGLEYEIVVFDKDSDYTKCMNYFNQTITADYCMLNMYHDSNSYSNIRLCLEQFDIPITQESECFYENFPDLLTSNNPIFTAADFDCRKNYNYTCEKCNNLTNSFEFVGQFLGALKSGEPINLLIDQLITQNPECKRIDGVFDQYESCLQNIQEIDFIQLLNTKLQQKIQILRRKGDEREFSPISSKAEFCEIMFPESDEIDSKIACYGYVGLPMGPMKCLIHKRVSNKNAYEFNLFYKYLCLHTEGVILDQVPSVCLDRELIKQKKLYKIEECLREYEVSGLKPHLILERSQYYFLRGDQEDEVSLEKISDRDTDITIQQIEQFLCENKTLLHFVSSPFQVIEDYTFLNMNEFDIKFDCSIFAFENVTRANLMVYYRFSKESAPQKTNPNSADLYNEGFNINKLVVDRIEQNQQYFKLEFSEDLDLIQILSHKLYHLDNKNESQSFSVESQEDFLRLASNPLTLKVFETYPQVISQELLPNQIIQAESIKEIEIDANVTKSWFGLPYEYSGAINYRRIQVKKINEVPKPIKKDQLIREEKNRINEFRVDLEIDFSEVVQRTSYYTTLDILAELGGLSASVYGILGQLGVFFLIAYNFQLSNLISRKYMHSLKLGEIKQYLKLLPMVEKVVKVKLGQNENETEKAQLQEDLMTLEMVIVKDFEHKYDLTNDRYEALKDLFQRYLPQYLDSKARFQHQKEQNLDDEFELIEIDENEMKQQLHESNASMPLGDILSTLRERISFFGVYTQTDSINQNKFMIKKLKYQIKLEREKREKVEGQVKLEHEKREKIEDEMLQERLKRQRMEQKVDEMLKRNDNLLQRIQSLEKKQN